MSKLFQFLGKNIDTAMLTIALAELQFKNIHTLNSFDELIIEAVKRSTNVLNDDSSIEDVISYIRTYDEDQILGLVNNIKGIYHELYFVELENDDGDAITAELFEETNHEGFDVRLTNSETGEVEDIQIKATDDINYINEWIESHGGNTENIFVTDEIADKMNLNSTEISNREITINTEDFIEKAIDLDDESLWDIVPHISLVSIGFILVHLYGMYKKGDIDKKTFKKYIIIFSGKKITKTIVLTAILGIPVIGQTVGAFLVYNLLNQGKNLLTK